MICVDCGPIKTNSIAQHYSTPSIMNNNSRRLQLSTPRLCFLYMLTAARLDGNSFTQFMMPDYHNTEHATLFILSNSCGGSLKAVNL